MHAELNIPTMLFLSVYIDVLVSVYLCLEAQPHEGYGKADCVCGVCLCVSVHVSAPAVQLLNGCNATKTNSFYRFLATFLIRELAN